MMSSKSILQYLMHIRNHNSYWVTTTMTTDIITEANYKAQYAIARYNFRWAVFQFG